MKSRGPNRIHKGTPIIPNLRKLAQFLVLTTISLTSNTILPSTPSPL